MDQEDQILGRILDQLCRRRVLAVASGLEALLTSVETHVPDRHTTALLDALVRSDVIVVIASRARRVAIEPWRERVRGVWWVAESGAWRHIDVWRRGIPLEPVDAWIGRLVPGANVIAIGDGLVVDEFPQLAPYELAVIEPVNRTRLRRRFDDVTTIHKLLWRVARARAT